MTELLNIDMAKFKAECARTRNSFSVISEADFAILERTGWTRRGWYKNMLDADEFRLLVAAPAKTVEQQADELRTELRLATRFSVVGNYGATKDQIEAIVMVAKTSGDFARWEGINRLTRAEANRIIDFATK